MAGDDEDFGTDEVELSRSEHQFCSYVQANNQTEHPERTYQFDELHIDDVLGCLYKAALARTHRLYKSCFLDITEAEGIFWEQTLQEYLTEYMKFQENGFHPTKTLVLKPIMMPKDIPKTLPTAVRMVGPAYGPPNRLVLNPTYYDGSILMLARRTRYGQDYVKMICRIKEEDYQKVNDAFELALGFPTRHLSFACDFWPTYFYQLAVCSSIFVSKHHELRVVFNEAPRFWELNDMVSEYGEVVQEEFMKRLTVLRKCLGNAALHSILYDYESITRFDETLCRDCSFLGNPCLGLPPIKTSYLRPRETNLIRGLGEYYKDNLDAPTMSRIRELKATGEPGEEGEVIRVGRQPLPLMTALSTQLAKFAATRLAERGKSIAELETPE